MKLFNIAQLKPVVRIHRRVACRLGSLNNASRCYGRRGRGGRPCLRLGSRRSGQTPRRLRRRTPISNRRRAYLLRPAQLDFPSDALVRLGRMFDPVLKLTAGSWKSFRYHVRSTSRLDCSTCGGMKLHVVTDREPVGHARKSSHPSFC
jgi:hypothetical protein